MSPVNQLAAAKEPGRLEKRGYQPKTPRKVITDLNPTQKLFLEYLLIGCSKPDLCAQINVQPFVPLSIEQSADLTRLRRRYARWLFGQAAFKREYNRGLDSIRSGAKVAAVRTQIELMNDKGDGSAAFAATRLKAASALLSDDGKANSSTVNVSVNTAIQLQPGVVIRLRDDVAKPPLELQAETDVEHFDQAALPNSIEQDDSVTLDPLVTEQMARNWPQTVGGDNEL